jgi:hypothetical protein
MSEATVIDAGELPDGDLTAGTPPPSDAGIPPASDAGTPPAADPTGEPPAGDPPAEPDDWRARLAGDDKKLLGYLARIPSEKAAFERLKKYEDDFKAGKFLKPLGDKPTDEEVAAWRAQLGVPEKPEDYTLSEGLVVGDEDKPFVDKFLASMHGANAPPAVVNAALETYYGIVEEQAAQEAEIANTAKSESIEALREEWGGDYKRNLNVMHGYLDTLPEEVANAFRYGKGADGVPLGFNAAVLKWLTERAMETNPVATVVPGAGTNQASAIADEIARIEKVMREDRTAYNRDDKMQARYRELIGAQLRLDGKG